MMTGAGLLGYLARDFDRSRLGAAQCRAPWRGAPSVEIHRAIGGIVALGAAQAAEHRHLAVGLHGRIDNLADLARDVGIDPAQPCAVLGEMYLRYGDTFASRLLGDFAILVLDERRETLLGVRDWVAARPLFWSQHDDVVAFGSEVKQVLALLDRAYRIDENTAEEYRTLGDLPATATFARGVLAVAASGQVLATVGKETQQSTRPVHFEPLDLSMAEAAALIRERLDTAVERRMQGASRPAALISGGMDSTSVAAAAAALAQCGRVAPLAAGIGLHFPDVPGTDETRYAQDLAELWDIPWRPVTVSPHDLTTDPTALLLPHDGPVFPGVQFFDRLFAEAQRCGADLVLTGQQADVWQTQLGDELKLSVLRREWQSALSWALHGVRRHPRGTVKSIAGTAKAVLRKETESAHFADRISGYWIRTAHEFEERLGHYYGLRVESPFVDRELAEALVGLSPRLRSNHVGQKLPLRAAMSDRLPRSILKRMDKSFFDPVFVAGYGPAQQPRTTGHVVAEHYLAAWRCQVVHGPQ